MEHVGNAVVMAALAGVVTLGWLGFFVAAVMRARPKTKAAPPAAARVPTPEVAAAFDWKGIGKSLEGDVHGQELAIAVLLEELQARLVLPERHGAACSFLFVGPPGVGKTAMGRSLARRLGCHLVDVDMATLDTSPGAALAGPLKEHPRAVVLLDDVDKAEPSYFPLLKWMLEGESFGPSGAPPASRTDARRAIVILTTSAGHEKLGEHLGRRGAALEDALRRVVLEHGKIPKELLSRIDRVVPFVTLSHVAMLAIIEDAIVQTAAAMKVELEDVGPDVLAHLFKGVGGKDFGILALRKGVERALAPKLAPHKGGKVRLGVVRDVLEVRAG